MCQSDQIITAILRMRWPSLEEILEEETEAPQCCESLGRRVGWSVGWFVCTLRPTAAGGKPNQVKLDPLG